MIVFPIKQKYHTVMFTDQGYTGGAKSSVFLFLSNYISMG